MRLASREKQAAPLAHAAAASDSTQGCNLRTHGCSCARTVAALRTHGCRYDSSEKQRVPSWTDRVLWSGLAASGVTPIAYVSCQSVLCSDHKPVVALLRFQPLDVDGASPADGAAAGGAVRQGSADSLVTGPVITDSLIDFGDLAAPTPYTPAAAAAGDAATLLLQPPAAVPLAASPSAAVDLFGSSTAFFGEAVAGSAPSPPPPSAAPSAAAAAACGDAAAATADPFAALFAPSDLFDAPSPPPATQQQPQQPQQPQPQPRTAAVLPLGGAPPAHTPPIDAGAAALFPPSELFGAGGGDCGGGGGAFGSAGGKPACAAGASTNLFDAIGTAVAAFGEGASGGGVCGGGGCGGGVCSGGGCGGASGGSMGGAFGGMGSAAGAAAGGGVAGGWGACPAMATPMQSAPASMVAPAPATHPGSPAPAPALSDAFSGLGVGDLMSASKAK